MSQGAFSKAITELIIKRARDNLLAMGSQLGVDKDGKVIVKDESPLNLKQIRLETDPAAAGYQSVISRGGLAGLARSFTEYSQGADLYQQAGELLARSELYDQFKKYVIETKYSALSSRRSTTKLYDYQTLTTSKDRTIRIGTSKDPTTPEEDIIIFKNLSHGEFKPIFIEFLGKYTSAGPELIEFISNNLDAGHLAGAFNIRLRRVFNLQVSDDGSGTYRDFKVAAGTDKDLNETFNKILLLIHDADYVSSNIVYDIKLFTSVAKDIHRARRKGPQVSVELQLSILNQEAGRALIQIGRQLNNLIVAVDASKSRVDAVAARKAVDTLLKNLQSVITVIKKTVEKLQKVNLNPAVRKELQQILSNATTTEGLINARGSASFKESIAEDIAAALSGKKLQQETTKFKNSIAQKITVLQKDKKTAPKLKPIAKPKPISIRQLKLKRFVQQDSEILSLQNLLQMSLTQQIKDNMGSGSSRDVLNLRSGRFAESVKVEKLSQGREGTISVYYNYMKYPYATFSQGGKQQYPRSRDPKLLISKSIRQLAAQAKITRLRSVLV